MKLTCSSNDSPQREGSFFRARAIAAVVGLLVLASAFSAEGATYRVDFVSTAAMGHAMNDQGIAAGERSTLPAGCTPSTCLGVDQAVVWSGSTATPLPLIPGFATVTAVSINSGGVVAGYAGDPTGTGARAVVWKPTGTSYRAINLGVLPNTTNSWAAGIDDLGRVVGWTTTAPSFPPRGTPFVWTEATGMVDLGAQGFPIDVPLAISPGGAVATPSFWYRLGNRSSVTPLAPPPSGFSGPGSYPAAINDAGEQGRFQISNSTQFFLYLFRYHQPPAWQQIWFLPGGQHAALGIGAINAAADITATVGGIGVVADGPAGLGVPLSSRLSPAYGGGPTADTTIVPTGGPINASGQILARVMIGLGPRLVRLVPTERCTSGCIRVASIQMTGKMNGRSCIPSASNTVTATVAVTDENGTPLPGATVAARFLDQYYLDEPVTGRTGAGGTVKFVHRGPACVGSTSILVDNATVTGRVLDFTTGELTDSVIPRP